MSKSTIKYVETRPDPLPDPLPEEPSAKELMLWALIATLMACGMFFALGLEYVYNT